jgi:hypothetical protein
VNAKWIPQPMLKGKEGPTHITKPKIHAQAFLERQNLSFLERKRKKKLLTSRWSMKYIRRGVTGTSGRVQQK